MYWVFLTSPTRQMALLSFYRAFGQKMATEKRKGAQEDLTPPKRLKLRQQSYRDSYSAHWPCLKRSDRGAHFVYCAICAKHFSCSHAGKNDCFRHISSKQHKDLSDMQTSHKKISDFCQHTSSEESLKVIKAETVMSEMIAEMNLSLSTADVLCRAIKKMCPDSKIAKEMRCGRNKATAIIRDLSRITKTTLIDRMKVFPYTISTDGGQDQSSKQYPLVIRTLDPVTGGVNSELLSIPVCDGSATGENIFQLLDRELTEKGIPWDNCLALGCDNANVMTGNKKGVFAFVKKKQPCVFLSGCTLHLVHIAAKKAAEALPAIDEVLIDIFYFFNKSEKRKSEFRGTQSLYDVEQRKMLKHGCTRWLSIQRCLERLLFNWDALKVYFKGLSDKSKEQSTKATQSKKPFSEQKEHSYSEKKVEGIFNFVRSPTNKLYVLFLNYTVRVFEDVLVGLQAEDPRIHALRKSLLKVLRNLISRFVKPTAISGKEIFDVQYKIPSNQKADSDLIIGDAARQFIADKENNHLKERRIKEFYSHVRYYFVKACDYICDKLPLNEPLLIHAEVTDVSNRETAKSEDLLYFLDRFPCLIPQGTNKDGIIEEFCIYQVHEEIDQCVVERMDQTWFRIGNIQENGKKIFANLSQVMRSIQTIPHSSAHCERVFSTVRKNRTEQRSSLSDLTLESLLVLKSQPGDFLDREYSSSTLRELKQAYYRYNHEK